MNHVNRAERPWAVVTGASGGIGLEFARNLAADGHDLVLIARNEEALAALASELGAAHGTRSQVLALDLGARDGADAVAQALRDAGIAPAVLVNNAGFGVYGAHVDTSLDDEQAMLDLNITALTRLTKLLLPAMVAARHGRIVNVASTAAFQPGPLMAVYYATKAYVLSYSEALAEELAGSGVTVTALCPGPTLSGFQARSRMDKAALLKTLRMPTSKSVADYGLRAMHAGTRVAVHGVVNKLLAQSNRVTPRRVATKIVKWLSRPVD